MADVELAFQRILPTFQDGRVVAPGNFSHQWRQFFQAVVRLKESLHPPEVGGRKTARRKPEPPCRHSGEGPPAWMQVVEQRLEQAAEESSGLDNTFPLERECPFALIHNNRVV